MAGNDTRSWNPFSICAALEVSTPQGGESADGLWLNAELIFGSEPIANEEVSFRLGVKAGFLKLDLEGCTAVLQSRYAMLDQPASIARETREEERRHDTLKAEAGAGAMLVAGAKGVGGQAKLGVSAAGGRTHERTVITTR